MKKSIMWAFAPLIAMAFMLNSASAMTSSSENMMCTDCHLGQDAATAWTQQAPTENDEGYAATSYSQNFYGNFTPWTDATFNTFDLMTSAWGERQSEQLMAAENIMGGANSGFYDSSGLIFAGFVDNIEAANIATAAGAGFSSWAT